MKLISKYKNAIVTVETDREEEKLRKLGYTPYEESEVTVHTEDETESEKTAPIDGDTESKTDGDDTSSDSDDVNSDGDGEDTSKENEDSKSSRGRRNSEHK